MSCGMSFLLWVRKNFKPPNSNSRLTGRFSAHSLSLFPLITKSCAFGFITDFISSNTPCELISPPCITALLLFIISITSGRSKLCVSNKTAIFIMYIISKVILNIEIIYLTALFLQNKLLLVLQSFALLKFLQYAF